jgi:uncharacterized ion transporter superfamily protein YfcC
MSKYEPGAPGWWTEQQRKEQEAAERVQSEADALKQARRARFIAVARRVMKAVGVAVAVFVMVVGALFGLLAGTGASRRRR